MSGRRRSGLIGGVAVRRLLQATVALLAAVACTQTTVTPSPAPTTPPASPPLGPVAAVTRVIDGDTIDVSLVEGDVVTVRLIGIDTPETVHPSKPVECFGKEAAAFTRSELEGQTVRLEFDVQQLDRFGRTLAYVWKDAALFNELLVAEGYAQVSTFPPNVKYVDRFLAAQRRAREQDRGLWGRCPLEPES